MYTLGEAAKATGKSKAAIGQAIHKGRISAKKDENGRWQIEPSELHRVYPVATQVDGKESDRKANFSTELQAALHRVEILESELRAANAQVEDLRDQRERLRADVEVWRAMATQKRLTWRGLFGGGKAE